MAGRQAACADRHHGRRHQRDLFGLPGRGGRHRVHLGREVFTDKGMPSSLCTDRGSHYSTPPRQAGRRSTHPSAAPSISSASAAYSPEARGPSAIGTLRSRNWRWRGSRRSKPPTASSQLRQSPLRHPARARRRAFVPLVRPDQVDDILCLHTERCATKGASSAPPQPDTTTSRPGPGPRVSRRNPRPLPRAPMPRPLHRQRRSASANPAGRVRRFDATGRRPVDKWDSPQGKGSGYAGQIHLRERRAEAKKLAQLVNRMRHLVTAAARQARRGGVPAQEVLQPTVAAVHRLHMQIAPNPFLERLSVSWLTPSAAAQGAGSRHRRRPAGRPSRPPGRAAASRSGLPP